MLPRALPLVTSGSRSPTPSGLTRCYPAADASANEQRAVVGFARVDLLRPCIGPRFKLVNGAFAPRKRGWKPYRSTELTRLVRTPASELSVGEECARVAATRLTATGVRRHRNRWRGARRPSPRSRRRDAGDRRVELRVRVSPNTDADAVEQCAGVRPARAHVVDHARAQVDWAMVGPRRCPRVAGSRTRRAVESVGAPALQRPGGGEGACCAPPAATTNSGWQWPRGTRERRRARDAGGLPLPARLHAWRSLLPTQRTAPGMQARQLPAWQVGLGSSQVDSGSQVAASEQRSTRFGEPQRRASGAQGAWRSAGSSGSDGLQWLPAEQYPFEQVIAPGQSPPGPHSTIQSVSSGA